MEYGKKVRDVFRRDVKNIDKCRLIKKKVNIGEGRPIINGREECGGYYDEDAELMNECKHCTANEYYNFD